MISAQRLALAAGQERHAVFKPGLEPKAEQRPALDRAQRRMAGADGEARNRAGRGAGRRDGEVLDDRHLLADAGPRILEHARDHAGAAMPHRPER